MQRAVARVTGILELKKIKKINHKYTDDYLEQVDLYIPWKREDAFPSETVYIAAFWLEKLFCKWFVNACLYIQQLPAQSHCTQL